MNKQIKSSKRAKTLALVSLVLAVLFIGGGLVGVYYKPEPEPRGNTQGPATLNEMGGDFTLTGHNGSKVSLNDYRGKVVMMFFGFTNCPGACPTTLNYMARVMKKLGDKSGNLQVLFISVDPERDTPERLKSFVTQFNPEFVGLTGSLEELSAVARQYGTKFNKVAGGSEKIYAVAHSVFLYMIDQEGRMKDFYHIDTPLDEITARIEKLITAKG